MPYIGGLRVSQEEWIARNGSLQQFHTGPDGENPAPEPEVEDGQPVPKPKKKRSSRSTKATKAAIADALGVTTLPDDIDVENLAEDE
jgi:hypothetical protein